MVLHFLGLNLGNFLLRKGSLSMLWWSGQATFISLVCGGSLDFEDFEDLLDFAMSSEGGLFAENFDHERA